MPSKDKAIANSVAAKYRANNKEAVNERFRQQRLRVKKAVFEAYGGFKCAGCGELDQLVLTLDHINQDGANHKMACGKRYAGHHLYRKLLADGLPDGYRVLCANCQIRAFNGVL